MVKFEVHGADELRKKLSSLLPKQAKNAARGAVFQAARGMRDEMKNRVPVDEGDLKKAIKARRKRGTRESFESIVEIINSGWYWHFIEFGTVKASAQPFILPTIEILGPKFPKEFGEELKKRIEKVK